jgi:hypothetical protein
MAKQFRIRIHNTHLQAEEFKDSEAWTVKRLRRRARSHHAQRQGGDKEAEKEEEEEKERDSSEEPSLLESVMRASTLASGTRPPGIICLYVMILTRVMVRLRNDSFSTGIQHSRSKTSRKRFKYF